MRKLLIMVLFAALAVPVLAADQGESPRRDRRARPGQAERGQRERGQRVERRGHPLMGILAQLNLSDEQKEQIRQIFKEQREKWQQQNGEKGPQLRQLLKQLREARKAGDDAKVAKIREQIKQLRPGMDGRGAVIEDIKKILTDEQRAKLEHLLKSHRPEGAPGPQADGRPRMEQIIHSLNLTPEQQDKVRRILEDHHEAVMAYRKANAEKFKDLISQMQQARKDGDKEKIKRIAGQLRQLHQGGPSPKDLFDKLGTVLNADQLAQLKEKMKAQMQRRHDGPPHPGRARPDDGGERPQGKRPHRHGTRDKKGGDV